MSILDLPAHIREAAQGVSVARLAFSLWHRCRTAPARTPRLVLRAAPLALALLLAPPAAAQTRPYTLTLLPSFPRAINQAGDILGNDITSTSQLAYLITGGKTITIPPLSGQTASRGISLNDLSQALCSSIDSSNTTKFFIYDYSKGTSNATVTEVTGIEALTNSPAHLNNAGEIVGYHEGHGPAGLLRNGKVRKGLYTTGLIGKQVEHRRPCSAPA